jgi:RimJ/RimL family protein N-acetyltransferase
MSENEQNKTAPLDATSWPVHTARLMLRPALATDEDAMWAYWRLDEVGYWGSWHPADQDDWRARLAPRWHGLLVIELDGRVIGDVMVTVGDSWAQREVQERARGVQAELGWTLNPAVAGRGYASEAVREVLRMCFEDLHLRRVTANAFAANEASCRLAERVGMRREVHTVASSLHSDLGWIDGVGYALLAEEWAGNR